MTYSPKLGTVVSPRTSKALRPAKIVETTASRKDKKVVYSGNFLE